MELSPRWFRDSSILGPIDLVCHILVGLYQLVQCGLVALLLGCQDRSIALVAGDDIPQDVHDVVAGVCTTDPNDHRKNV